MSDLKAMYKQIISDSFPARMEIAFYNDDSDRQVLIFEKKQWEIDGELKGLRYGENPDQEAALYVLKNGNLKIGRVDTILPGRYLASDVELLQSGKHPGKTNITDADNALNILRYFQDRPCCVIVKHNNPCGVALADSVEESYLKAYFADRIAAFGGAVALNRELDLVTARHIAGNYTEVVIAPSFAEGVMEVFAEKKNLRVMQIKRIDSLQDFVGQRYIDFKALIDGGIIVQSSYAPKTLSKQDFLPAECEYKGKHYAIDRQPSEQELSDMRFGWLVESGITSNSVIYVKNGVTVGIGTGEQDRVGVAEIARDKAYRKLCDKICWDRYQKPWFLLDDDMKRKDITEQVNAARGGLRDSVMISDAFFPFRDGIDVGLKEGVSAVVQPGGSLRDFEVIEACNEYKATMLFTGQRSFKH